MGYSIDEFAASKGFQHRKVCRIDGAESGLHRMTVQGREEASRIISWDSSYENESMERVVDRPCWNIKEGEGLYIGVGEFACDRVVLSYNYALGMVAVVT